MNFMLDNSLRPITNSFAFIKADINLIVEEFLKWQTPLVAEFRNNFIKTNPSEELEKTLLLLGPLTTGESRRYLFIPTKSNWVAFFDNGHTGTDRTAPKVLAKKLNTECIYLSYDSQSEQTGFDFYGKVNNDSLDLIRAIAVIRESGWKFYEYGNPLPFEKLEAYKNRMIKKRFNLSLLTEYLKEFGVDAYNDSFYLSKEAILINKQGPKFENTKELTLLQAQHFFKS